MPRANSDPTIPDPRPPAAVTPITPLGDALILALAAHYRELTDAIDVLDEEATAWTGTMHTYLSNHQLSACDRRDSVHHAMCAVQASGLPGAMVQIELLYLMTENNGEIPDAYRRRHTQTMRECLVCSIFNVLAHETGRTEADGLDVLHRSRDEMRLDALALRDEWHAMLSRDGRSPGERKPTWRAAA